MGSDENKVEHLEWKMKPAAQAAFVREFEQNYKERTAVLTNCTHQEICSSEINRSRKQSERRRHMNCRSTRSKLILSHDPKDCPCLHGMRGKRNSQTIQRNPETTGLCRRNPAAQNKENQPDKTKNRREKATQKETTARPAGDDGELEAVGSSRNATNQHTKSGDENEN
jgi:hypothetical protein